MPLQNSPAIDHFQNGMPEKLPDASQKQRTMRIIISALFILVVILGIISFLKSDTTSILMKKGSISGVVLNEQNTPVPAELFILDANIQGQADASGSFTLENVPEGRHSLVAGYDGYGVEKEISIAPGQITDAGSIRIVTTAIP